MVALGGRANFKMATVVGRANCRMSGIEVLLNADNTSSVFQVEVLFNMMPVKMST